MDNYYYDDYNTTVNQGFHFDFDPVMLKSIGFTDLEVEALQFIMMNEGKVSVNTMVNYYGIPYEQAKRLKYMYDICSGRVVISSEDDLVKHLRKMFGQHSRIGINNLEMSKVSEVPRTALVGGIPKDSPFAIWNSVNYPVTERLYTVVDVTGANVIIETTRIPVLKYKQAKSIEGVLEIREGPTNGVLTVAVNKDYCKVCNRFVIVASLRRPEYHHGMVEIICFEGTRVYVFADTIKDKQYTRYGSNANRVYSYGFLPFEIKPKLMQCARDVYKSLHGVYSNMHEANTDFLVIPPVKETHNDDDIEGMIE